MCDDEDELDEDFVIPNNDNESEEEKENSGPVIQNTAVKG